MMRTWPSKWSDRHGLWLVEPRSTVRMVEKYTSSDRRVSVTAASDPIPSTAPQELRIDRVESVDLPGDQEWARRVNHIPELPSTLETGNTIATIFDSISFASEFWVLDLAYGRRTGSSLFFFQFLILCAKIPGAASTFSFFQKSKEKSFIPPRKHSRASLAFAFFLLPFKRRLFWYECMTVWFMMDTLFAYFFWGKLGQIEIWKSLDGIERHAYLLAMACTFMKQATSVRLYIIRMELALDRSVQIFWFVQVYALDEKGFLAGRHAVIKNDEQSGPK